MERSIEVATGESVAFSYELAGLGSRFFAVFIDIAIQIATVVIVVTGLAILAAYLPASSDKIAAAPLAKWIQAVLIALLVFAIFMLFFGYFILFEWLWGGHTPGKRVLGIRVVRDGGFPLDFTSSAIRNIVRMIDFGLGFYALSAIVMLLNPRNRRLGDLAAGTLVVRDNRYERAKALTARDLAETAQEDPILHDLTRAERDLVKSFAERASTLNADARRDLAARIAATVRPKLPVNYGNLGDHDLLEFLASRMAV